MNYMKHSLLTLDWFSLQTFLKYNQTFHKLFPDIPEGDRLTHGEFKAYSMFTSCFCL